MFKGAAAVGLSAALTFSSVAGKAADMLMPKTVRRTDKGVVKRITNTRLNEHNPSVSEKNIAWAVSDEIKQSKDFFSGETPDSCITVRPTNEIEVYDRDKRTKERITSNDHADILPTVHGRKLAWLDPGGANFYDLESREMEEVSLSRPITSVRSNIDLSPNDWFWWGNADKGFARNLSTGEQIKLSSSFSDSQRKEKLKIFNIYKKSYSPNNSFALFQDRVEGNKLIETEDLSQNIFSIDIDYMNENLDVLLGDDKTFKEKMFEQGAIEQITGSEFEQVGYISISPNRVVWQGKKGRDWDIFSYNLETEEITKLTSSPADQIQPEVYNDSVVWSDLRDGNQEIYLFEFTDGDSEENLKTEMEISDYPKSFARLNQDFQDYEDYSDLVKEFSSTILDKREFTEEAISDLKGFTKDRFEKNFSAMSFFKELKDAEKLLAQDFAIPLTQKLASAVQGFELVNSNTEPLYERLLGDEFDPYQLESDLTRSVEVLYTEIQNQLKALENYSVSHDSVDPVIKQLSELEEKTSLVNQIIDRGVGEIDHVDDSKDAFLYGLDVYGDLVKDIKDRAGQDLAYLKHSEESLSPFTIESEIADSWQSARRMKRALSEEGLLTARSSEFVPTNYDLYLKVYEEDPKDEKIIEDWKQAKSGVENGIQLLATDKAVYYTNQTDRITESEMKNILENYGDLSSQGRQRAIEKVGFNILEELNTKPGGLFSGVSRSLGNTYESMSNTLGSVFGPQKVGNTDLETYHWD